MKILFVGTLALAGAIATPASAMPLDRLTGVDNSMIQDVRLVCNSRGHCWQSAPRRAYRERYVEPRYGYRQDYYAPRRHYVEPGVGFNFRF